MKTKSSVLICALVLVVSSVGSVQDEVDTTHAFLHVKKLVEYSPRLAGSGTAQDNIKGGGYSAALYIAETLRNYGYDVKIEEFSFTTFQIREFTLIVDYDGDFSTSDQLDLSERAIPPTFRYLNISYDMVVPLVVLDQASVTNIMPGGEFWNSSTPESHKAEQSIKLVFRENQPAFVCRHKDTISISSRDYQEIREHKTANTAVYVNFVSQSAEVTGYNVVGVRRGRGKTVILTAHYDSVYSGGAIDNGSGVAALLETARILSNKKTEATLYFVFFDAEEIGLLGSEAFFSVHDFPQGLGINVDSIGSGDTVYVGAVPLYEDMWGSYMHTDEDTDSYIASIAASIVGYTPKRLHLETVGGYSDFASFTKKGIPCSDITTLDKKAAEIPVISKEKQSDYAFNLTKGERVLYYDENRFSKVIPYIHTSHDDINHLNKEIFSSGTRVVAQAAFQLSRTWEGEVEPAHVIFIAVVALIVGIIWYMRALST